MEVVILVHRPPIGEAAGNRGKRRNKHHRGEGSCREQKSDAAFAAKAGRNGAGPDSALLPELDLDLMVLFNGLTVEPRRSELPLFDGGNDRIEENRVAANQSNIRYLSVLAHTRQHH